MIVNDGQLSMRVQCDLLKINRSRMYCKSDGVWDMGLADMISDIYSENPVYGYRRITACLRREGHIINAKCTLRLMKLMGLRAIYPGPKTTISDKTHYKYPYALRGLQITKPHQVWQIDITYLRTDHGFMYMNALIDVKTRMIVGWSLSNSLDTESVLRTLEKAVDLYGVPDIINSDQGAQFTSEEWIKVLKNNGILISMSGKGRSNDNAYIERLWRTLKYEWTLLNGARTVADYKKLLPEFVHWYNTLRPHQSLRYKTPIEALKQEICGYVDKAIALTHIPTNTTSTIKGINSLIF